MTRPDDEQYRPDDLRHWLQQEVRDVLKAAELRIKDASDFVTAYASGAMSSEEVNKRKATYNSRWGDALPCGIETQERSTNEEILRKIDDAVELEQSESFTDRLHNAQGEKARQRGKS